MTAAAHEPYPNVIEASDSELRRSIRNAEKRSGYTYDQLAEQARTGDFESFKARLAWVAIGGLREIVERLLRLLGHSGCLRRVGPGNVSGRAERS